MLTIGLCEIPDEVVDVWKNTEWRLTKRGAIRAKSGKCPICEACMVIFKKSYLNSDYCLAAHHLNMDFPSVIVYAADSKSSCFRPDLEKALGLR